MDQGMTMEVVGDMAEGSDVAIRVISSGVESVRKAEEMVECHLMDRAVVESAQVNMMITTIGTPRGTAGVTAKHDKERIEVEDITGETANCQTACFRIVGI